MATTLFVQFLPAAGREHQVEEVLQRMVVNTRKEPGNLLYDLYRSTSAEGRLQYNLWEKYVDEAAIELHRKSDYFQQFHIDIVPLLAAPISLTTLSSVNVR